LVAASVWLHFSARVRRIRAQVGLCGAAIMPGASEQQQQQLQGDHVRDLKEQHLQHQAEQGGAASVVARRCLRRRPRESVAVVALAAACPPRDACTAVMRSSSSSMLPATRTRILAQRGLVAAHVLGEHLPRMWARVRDYHVTWQAAKRMVRCRISPTWLLAGCNNGRRKPGSLSCLLRLNAR